MPKPETITCGDLDEAIERYTHEFGYRLDMIMPADAPREALMSKRSNSLRLLSSSRFKVQGSKSRTGSNLEPGTLNLEPMSNSEWTAGRVGMMYRDLVPDRLGGKLIASHICIVDGGDVADTVHYHKIDFQVIYCLKGAIKVVYEDQGSPFWLQPGDCVLQPPEIRHRVLEAEAGSEVIEIASPVQHETWFDHEMQLPSANTRPDRKFGDQKFVLHTDSGCVWHPSRFEGSFETETGVETSTRGLLAVKLLKGTTGVGDLIGFDERARQLTYSIAGRGIIATFGRVGEPVR